MARASSTWTSARSAQSRQVRSQQLPWRLTSAPGGIAMAAADGSTSSVETCEVCIVGAGVTGLNALFVASQYLRRGQRVILVDRRRRAGGMWVDTYPYVRLHQPHPMFTA